MNLEESINTRIITRSISPTVPLVMVEAVKLMAAVCLVPPDGHDKVGFIIQSMLSITY